MLVFSFIGWMQDIVDTKYLREFGATKEMFVRNLPNFTYMLVVGGFKDIGKGLIMSVSFMMRAILMRFRLLAVFLGVFFGFRLLNGFSPFG